MSTTNLKYQSIGKNKISSGNGIPDHLGTAGDIYINIDTNTIFKCEGGTVWSPIEYACFGLAYKYSSTAPQIGINTTQWTRTCNRYLWYEDAVKGVYLNNGKLTIINPGLYRIIISGHLYGLNTNITEYKLAIIKNEDTSVELCSVDVIHSYDGLGSGQYSNFTAENIATLNKDDRLELVIRNVSLNIVDISLYDCYIIVIKITD